MPSRKEAKGSTPARPHVGLKVQSPKQQAAQGRIRRVSALSPMLSSSPRSTALLSALQTNTNTARLRTRAAIHAVIGVAGGHGGGGPAPMVAAHGGGAPMGGPPAPLAPMPAPVHVPPGAGPVPMFGVVAHPMAPVVAPPRVRFRLDPTGKVRYEARDDALTRAANAAHYMDMAPADFALFKNAGKRYASNKLTDPATAQSYVHHAGQYHLFDKAAPGNRGALAPNQAALAAQHAAGNLLDRSRPDRIGQQLQPFDLGHYLAAPAGSQMDVLSHRANTFGANRDHVPSGQSLRLRAANAADGNTAYRQGLVIAIPNAEMHIPHSPTFGGRQFSTDTVDGVANTRANHDAVRPALAFQRDVRMMLARTAGANHGAVDPTLDLTQAPNRVRQIGAYRKLFRANAQMFQANPARGIDPAEPARDIAHTPNAADPTRIGTFASAPAAGGGTQGAQITQHLGAVLRATGRAV